VFWTIVIIALIVLGILYFVLRSKRKGRETAQK
jgi:cbb3-type cytochrome oxidase subunit 3